MICAGFLAEAGTGPVPYPLPSHPGNIFLTGQTVTVPAPPAGDGDTWRALDYEGRVVAEGRVGAGPLDMGRLPSG